VAASLSRLTEAELEADPVVAKLFESTEEGQKVSRNAGEKWCAVFQRVADPFTVDTS
jgi:tRNA (guanine-N7-)-methyltransferase